MSDWAPLIFFGSLVLLGIGVITCGSIAQRNDFTECGKACGSIANVEESSNASCKCRGQR